MKRTALLIGLAGIILSVGLILDFDPAGIAQALGAVGFGGALMVSAYRVLPILLCSWGWRVLLPDPPRFWACLEARLGRDGVAGLLPLMPAGGEIVGARMLHLAGIPSHLAAAATIADVTLEAASQALFTILGGVALMMVTGGHDNGRWLVAGLALPVAMVAGLAAIQHPRILGLLTHMARKLAAEGKWAGWIDAERLTQGLQQIYASRKTLLAGLGIHGVAWLVGIGEAWLALRLMGQPQPLLTVLALEAVVFAVRSAAFVVPWAAGIQEGSYLALGALLGLSPETALTLSLVKRMPEVILGLPGLLLWYRRDPMFH